jgi:signal transduction histidine kinase
VAGDDDVIRKLRHDLANPLGALLTETQLLLMQDNWNEDDRRALQQIESLARQMRDILSRTRTEPHKQE